jgi:hypothetical protein
LAAIEALKNLDLSIKNSSTKLENVENLICLAAQLAHEVFLLFFA